MDILDSMRCVRCGKVAGSGALSHPAIGGTVGLECCITDADGRKVWPERYARIDRYDALMLELTKPHTPTRCAELEGLTHSVCPLHGSDEEE